MRYIFKEEREREKEREIKRERPDTFKIRKKWLR